jgi:hypothetical protein
VDFESVKLLPMWRNFHPGDVAIAKHIDLFLVFQDLLSRHFLFKSWVSSRGLSNHLPIMFYLGSRMEKLLAPFKFSHMWLQEEDFVNLIKNSWIPLSVERPSSYMHQFVENITIIKQIMKD